MLEELKREVFEANLKLAGSGLVILTWGNASGIDRANGLIVIKPSGVAYEDMKTDDMTVADLDGNAVEGSLAPSSDLPTHIALYKNFKGAGSIAHTHSPWAVSFAQAGMDIPVFGTTHADYFYGPVPCTREMTEEEIKGDYEYETGNVIVETFKKKDPMMIPAVLVYKHGPFVWGRDCRDAVENALILEETAKMAHMTMALDPGAIPVSRDLLDRHFFRKHGKDAYYGQRSGRP